MIAFAVNSVIPCLANCHIVPYREEMICHLYLNQNLESFDGQASRSVTRAKKMIVVRIGWLSW